MDMFDTLTDRLALLLAAIAVWAGVGFVAFCAAAARGYMS